ncbi:MAG TPA: endolytic transglycosylase MltG [Stellaceae bacterium]|nr:endolytic transglycosylase MltG [Stellaceae bacterium]
MRWFVGAFIVLVAALGGAATWAWQDYVGPGPLPAPRVAVLPKNARIVAIAETLGDAGIIAHPWVFVAGAELTRTAHTLQAGEYDFPAAISPASVASLLASGKVVQHRFTVAEGLTSAEVAAALADAPALEGTLAEPPPEGSLLPDTYFYVLGTTREALVTRMQHAMDRALQKAWQARAPDLPFTDPRQALILASIIEKETAVPDERPRVAGVYVDRLRIGMKLQADPTVVYALTNAGRAPLAHPLDHEDLAVASPYNTYLADGLPPGPIDNPGLASIHAALDPDRRGELYFVADGSGGHNFARTLDEQNHNVALLRHHQGGPGPE